VHAVQWRLILSLLLHSPPPISTPSPYTTLFRSGVEHRTHASSWPRGRPLVLAAIHTAWPIAVSKVRPSIPKSLKFTQVSSSKLRSEEHTSELQSRENLVCRLLLEKKKNTSNVYY